MARASHKNALKFWTLRICRLYIFFFITFPCRLKQCAKKAFACSAVLPIELTREIILLYIFVLIQIKCCVTYFLYWQWSQSNWQNFFHWHLFIPSGHEFEFSDFSFINNKHKNDTLVFYIEWHKIYLLEKVTVFRIFLFYQRTRKF